MIKVILPFFRSGESKIYGEKKFRILRSFQRKQCFTKILSNHSFFLKNVAFCPKANPLFLVDEKQWA
jgi:hypothetical protein